MKDKQTKKQLLLEIFRFLIVGVVATLCDYAVFCLFDALIFPLLPVAGGVWTTLFLCLSTALGFLTGLIVSWVLSVKYVFVTAKTQPQTRTGKKFALFSVIALVGLALTEIGVLIMTAVLPTITLFGTRTLFGTEWQKWLAKLVMTCIVLVWNYVARKLFVFRA